MNDEQRIKILKKYLPEYYLSIYLYVLYKDDYYLPNSLKRDGNNRRKVKQVELKKALKELSILMGRTILDLDGDEI